MSWFNGYGTVFVILLLLPNLIFAVSHRDGFENRYQNKKVEYAEQIGRFGSFVFMIFCPPLIRIGWWFRGAKTAYLIIGSVLVGLYLFGWVLFRKEDSVRKSLMLSILPSLLFLESGILTGNFPLILFSALFASGHIILSYQNAKLKKRKNESK